MLVHQRVTSNIRYPEIRMFDGVNLANYGWVTRPGQLSHNYGKIHHFLMGKSWKINDKLQFSIAMLVYQRVPWVTSPWSTSGVEESQQLRSQGPPGGVASMAALQENQQAQLWWDSEHITID